MKTIKRTQMKCFEGSTMTEFTDNFNYSMEWVGRFSNNYKDPVVDLANLRGYVIYEEVARIPEGYRDCLDIHNLRVNCGQCTHFCSSGKGWGTCKNCKSDIRKNDEACDMFFKAWESGECWLIGEEEKYEKAIHELRLEGVRNGPRSKAL